MTRGTAYSVVIPSYNEAHNIGRCLETVARAIGAREGIEILLADNGSRDATRDIAAAAGARVVVPPSRVSIAALRNLGAREAAGEVLLFLDADMEVPPDWMAAIEGHFAPGGADVLGFVERLPDGAPWFARIWSERIRARRDEVMEVDYLPGRNICVRRAFFEAVGGFDQGLTTSEDKDFIMRLKRAGARVMSDPGLDVRHWGYERSLRELMRKEFWRQNNHVNMVRRHGAKWRLLRFPLLSVGHALWPAVPAAVLAAGCPVSAAWLFAAWWGPALAMTLGYRLSRRSPLAALQFTFLYWLRFTVAGWSVLAELLTGRRVDG